MFVVVDWGTTNIRLYLLSNESSTPLIEWRGDTGISQTQKGEHENTFIGALCDLLQAAQEDELKFLEEDSPQLDVYFSGMITSDLGWQPTPYIETPLRWEQILEGETLKTIEFDFKDRVVELKLHFFPGMRTKEDIARGEELEAVGILGTHEKIWDSEEKIDPSREGILVLPGTHSKWIRFKENQILEFFSVPTGDVHAAFHKESLLSRTLPEGPIKIDDSLIPYFDRGCDAQESRGTLASLFLTRSLVVLKDQGLNSQQASAYLSGVLIGGEVKELLAYAENSPIFLGGVESLQSLYLRALKKAEAPSVRLAKKEWTSKASILAVRFLRQIR